MKLNVKHKRIQLVDFIFWITFILFTNPGGILKILGQSGDDGGGIKVSDLLYFVMFMCFIFIHRNIKINNDIAYKKIIKHLLIFLFYYFVVFSFMIPILKGNPLYSPISTLIKTRHSFINISLVMLVYNFYLRSHELFYRLFLYSSILVILLYSVGVFTGLDIIPIRTMDRKFIETKRLLMLDYGLMPILTTMAVVVIIFKFEIKYRKLILMAGALMFLAWLLAIFRRYIFGTIITLFITIMFHNYLKRKSLISMSKLVNIAMYMIVFVVIIQFTFPEYNRATVEAVKETVYVMQRGESSTGKKDVRFGSGKAFMQEMVRKNYLVGTGFDNRWRSKEGDNAGYEATDYPLLGAIAMYGILGMLIFLPVYIILIKCLKYDIKYFRKYSFSNLDFHQYVMIFLIIYYIYDFLQYMNWFLPLSIINDKKWYVFLGMYLASRNIFYNKIKKKPNRN